jgi:hypothetical protein
MPRRFGLSDCVNKLRYKPLTLAAYDGPAAMAILMAIKEGLLTGDTGLL